MYEFKTETQGLHTYRICELVQGETIDTVGIGMMMNNKLKGILPLTQMYMDNKCILKYNISSKVTLKQFFEGMINKEKIVKVFRSILQAIKTAEAYMLDMDLLLLQKEEIYVNVSTYEAELIYFPVLEQKKPIQIPLFFKGILFETAFDQSENCDYVTSLLNALNQDSGFSIENFQKLLEKLSEEKKDDRTFEKKKEAERVIKSEVPNVQPVAAYIPKTVQEVGVPSVSEPISPPVQMPRAADTPVPSRENNKKEKKSFFSFGRKDEKKDEKKDSKKDNKKGKKEKKAKTFSPNMEIPGMTSVQIPVQTPVKKVIQENNLTAPVSPIVPPPSVGNFGETTVLQAVSEGETTVLTMEETMSAPQVSNPYLIRQKTGEKIVINKGVFHLGKERSYADYCITDNSAVSRSHADIMVKGEQCYIVDNNSLNHTFINGQQIAAQTEVPLKDNSAIRLANEEFEFRSR